MHPELITIMYFNSLKYQELDLSSSDVPIVVVLFLIQECFAQISLTLAGNGKTAEASDDSAK